jgi:hypothetical protein
MADPNRGLIQSHLQTTEGYGDAQSTYIPSATNRDMHATSAAEGSPTGVLEGANQNQVTKRAMAMRLIYNAREATANLVVEKFDQMPLHYNGPEKMRGWNDKLRPLLQHLEYTLGSNRARTPINLACLLSPKPLPAEVYAALAPLVVSLASVKGNAAVIENEEFMIMEAIADLCSDRTPEIIERSLRTLEGSVIGRAFLEEATSELQKMDRKLCVALAKAVKLTGFEQTLTALTQEANAKSET